ncbi:MAG: nitroreductase family protein [Anaerolineales bacterium]
MSTTATDLHNFMRTRRSVRRFKSDPVPDSVIETILTTATFAPSAHNRQPWRFVVVANSFVRTKLADAMAHDFQRDLESDGIPLKKFKRK